MNSSLLLKIVSKTYIPLFFSSIFLYIINSLLIKNLVPANDLLKWNYSLPFLYIFFIVFSFLILSLLLVVRQRNLDYVGNAFLLLTSIKMVISYFILRPILATSNFDSGFEKKNFFIIFICFLAIETFLTIRILNNKQGNE